MTIEELVDQAQDIIGRNDKTVASIEALEFLRIYAGEKSAFYKQGQLKNENDWIGGNRAIDALRGYVNFLSNGLTSSVSIERAVQIEVVSDFLEQAQKLLFEKNVHPAAACVLIGASLEEFLRNWIDELDLKLGNNKPGIENYSKLLREKELINKQDAKDILSWGGLRNHAAHGEWNYVEDKARIGIMLDGVNLFMRKYGK